MSSVHDAFRKAGATLIESETPYKLWVGYNGKWVPVAVLSLSERHTDAQLKFRDDCLSDKLPQFTARTKHDIPIILERVEKLG